MSELNEVLYRFVKGRFYQFIFIGYLEFSFLDNRKSNTSLFKCVKTFPFKALHNRNSAIVKPTSFKAQLDQFIKWEIRDDCL